MSRTQTSILIGLGLITALVCLVAIALIQTQFTPIPTPPTSTYTPQPTSTDILTPTQTPEPDTGDQYGAAAICKKFVKDRLIAPRDAKWPGIFDEGPDVIQTGLTTWRIRSWVDAANRFGVHIHTEYTCVVRYLGDDRWQLEYLDLQDPTQAAMPTVESTIDTPTPASTPTPLKCYIGTGNTYIEVDCD